MTEEYKIHKSEDTDEIFQVQLGPNKGEIYTRTDIWILPNTLIPIQTGYKIIMEGRNKGRFEVWENFESLTIRTEPYTLKRQHNNREIRLLLFSENEPFIIKANTPLAKFKIIP